MATIPPPNSTPAPTAVPVLVKVEPAKPSPLPVPSIPPVQPKFEDLTHIKPAESKPIPPLNNPPPTQTEITKMQNEAIKKFEKEAKKRGYVKLGITKSKIAIRESIPTTWFLGFLGAIFFVMMSRGMIQWWNFDNDGFFLLCYIVFFSTLFLLGIDKPAVVKLGVEIIKILFDPTLKNETKLAYIKTKIEELMGLAIALKLQDEAEKELNPQ